MPNAETALPTLIRDLLDPAVYRHPVDRVRLLQTHISYVLIAGDHVYKIKKPVNFGFLDFSTLAKRRRYCALEVTLNSRLCADTYLGVAPIRESNGGFSFTGDGPVAEYAVHMRRLPEDRMMHRLLEEGLVTPDLINALANRLANFHANAETSAQIAAFGDRSIRAAWRDSFTQWAPQIGHTITQEQDAILRAYGETFFARNRALLQSRVDNLHIRDCHGDLRSDAVCFQDGICIFDCIEFNREFRYTDVAGDVGFLAMDLDYRGHPEVASAFVDRYVEASGDSDLRAIIDFYRCYRACVRGKVEGFLLGQPEVPAAEKRRAVSAARRYFDLACGYAGALRPPFLLITCGLAASGKSTFARRLAQTAGFQIVSSDVVRKALAGLQPTDRRFETFGEGIYSAGATDRTYTALLDEARGFLDKGHSVILDASYIRRDHRRAAQALARESGAQFACLRFQASDAAIHRRLNRRLRQGADPSDARWETYVNQKRRFQRPTEVPTGRLITIDTSKPQDAQLRTVLKALRAISPLSLP